MRVNIPIISTFFGKPQLTKKNQKVKAISTIKRKEAVTLKECVKYASIGVSSSTQANYLTAVESFKIFHRGKDIKVSELTSELVKEFEKWLREKGNCQNTVSCYLRSLRAIYNKAVKRHRLRNRRPFQGLRTGNVPALKRSIGEEDLRRLQEVELPARSSVALSRDLFLFSFYSMGMSPVDIAHLKWKNVKEKFITYSRHKTQQQVNVCIEPCMQKILNKYRKKGAIYVFPALDGRKYSSFLSTYNRNLKKVGDRAGILVPLTSYVPRHTWASLAYAHGVELSVIAKAMGHSNAQTTLTYIQEVDNQLLAKANKKLLRKLLTAPLLKR